MEYLIHIALFITTFGIAALGVNLLVGYTGLLSVGQAIYSGIGGYMVAILTVEKGMNFFPAAVIGIATAVAMAFVMGLLLSKFSEDYYTLVTVGFNVIFVSVLFSWSSLTRGSYGIPGVARPHIPFFDLHINFNYLIFCAIIFFGVYLLSHALVKSSFGRVLQAIREDQKAVQVFGYRVFYYKLLIYMIAAGFGALGGALFAPYLSFIEPSGFTVLESIYTLSAVVLGGLANIRATILGIAILVILPELLRFVGLPTEVAAQMRNLIFGLLLIVLMIYKPEGLMGKYKF